MYQKQVIKGLTYLPNFITKQQEIQLVEYLLDRQWNTSLKRRTQHYGFTYSYDKKNSLTTAQPIPGLLVIFKKSIQTYIRENLQNQQLFDQIIVNQYLPGQGISAHIDSAKLFDSVVVSLSLNSDVVMKFQNEKGNHVQKLLERRSLLILEGQSRYKWKHTIASRKSDHGTQRKTRYSLTFRKVIQKQLQK